MSANTYRLYPLLAVALLAAGTTWLERATREEAASVEGPSTTPDALVSQARVLRYDKQGRLQQQLDSVSMRHYPADGSADLVEPQLHLFQEQGEILIVAREGKVLHGGEEVHLNGAVKATRTMRDKKVAPLEFKSESLLVHPNEQQASTIDPVALRQGSSIVHSNTMHTDNIFGTLQFEGAVRSTIQSRKTP